VDTVSQRDRLGGESWQAPPGNLFQLAGSHEVHEFPGVAAGEARHLDDRHSYMPLCEARRLVNSVRVIQHRFTKARVTNLASLLSVSR